MERASKEMKIWFAVFGVIIWLGIYLTGFSDVHWLLYVPAVALIFCGFYWNKSKSTINKQFVSLYKSVG